MEADTGGVVDIHWRGRVLEFQMGILFNLKQIEGSSFPNHWQELCILHASYINDFFLIYYWTALLP